MQRSGTYTIRLAAVVVAVMSLFSLSAFAAEASSSPRVTASFFETDLRDALGELSLQTGVTIVYDRTVSGVVTADIKDLSLEEALRILLIGGGYKFRRVDNFYFVGLVDTRSSTFAELVETKVMTLNHITVEKLLAIMPAYLQPYIKGEPKGTTLSMTAAPSELGRIAAIIAEVDKPQRQIEVKVVVTEVTSQAVKELGGTLLDFSASHGQRSNPDWTGSLQFDGELLTIETDVFGDLLAKLRLLQEKQQAKIHADPRLLVASGEQAELFAGDRQIIIITPKDDTDITSRVERIEVGMSLKLTATAFGTDEILLRLAPEISHFVAEARPDIVVKNNSVSTAVRLRTGQTAMLAGMMLEDTSDYSQKVPILGSIPLIRWLFRSDVQRKASRELLVFVTPVIQ